MLLTTFSSESLFSLWSDCSSVVTAEFTLTFLQHIKGGVRCAVEWGKWKSDYLKSVVFVPRVLGADTPR